MQADSNLVTYLFEAYSYGGAHNPNIAVIHDIECPLKKGYARTLTGPAWFGGPSAKTSSHYVVGPDDICQGVPENRIAWHCGNGNLRTIAIEQCGYASNSATDWDTPDGLVQQENVSKLLADISIRRPLIKLRTLSDSELLYAWGNPGVPGGVVTHQQMARVIKGTTHYDPFNSPNTTVAYPLVRVINRAVAIAGGTVTPPPVEKDWFEMTTAAELEAIVQRVVSEQLEIYLADASPYTSNMADKVLDRLTNPVQHKTWFDKFWYGQQVENHKQDLVNMIIDAEKEEDNTPKS